MSARMMNPRTRRAASVVAALLLGASASACTPIKPYERGLLAHPSMSGNRLSGPGVSHMQAVHEGAMGGAIGAEGGCGCN